MNKSVDTLLCTKYENEMSYKMNKTVELSPISYNKNSCFRWINTERSTIIWMSKVVKKK